MAVTVAVSEPTAPCWGMTTIVTVAAAPHREIADVGDQVRPFEVAQARWSLTNRPAKSGPRTEHDIERQGPVSVTPVAGDGPLLVTMAV